MVLAKYHRFISLTGYLIGFILFVLSLVKGRYRIQFYMVFLIFFMFNWFLKYKKKLEVK